MFGLHCSCDKHPRFHGFENIDKEFLESGNYKRKTENSTTTVFLQSEWSKRQTSYIFRSINKKERREGNSLAFYSKICISSQITKLVYNIEEPHGT